jgi:hypothetical protein
MYSESLAICKNDANSPASIQANDLSDYPKLPRRFVLRETPSGEIAVEQGADGLYLRFDCDCMHALPVCQAQCCGLIGTIVFDDELEKKAYPVEWEARGQEWVLERQSDGFCKCLDRDTRLCTIYADRPRTCQQFHCTRGAEQRGWKLANHVSRQNI